VSTDWIKRPYDAVGVTQMPPGPYLPLLQEPYVGKVLLCIDVSGSMSARDKGGRTRLQRAVAGAEQFVDEAVRANYRVGLILWDHGVSAYEPVAEDPREVRRMLGKARIAGGTNVTPALKTGIRELGALTGDRVMAIFGDGDIGPVKPAVRAAREAAALGIRIVVRGLGQEAADALRRIATEDADHAAIPTAAGIESGIASMVTSLTARTRDSPA